jgi:prepilin-type N-terminal cleavage/methylation domain-containing protein
MGRQNSFFSFKNTSLRTNQGLTLSEVLVVIAILGILIISVAFFIRPTFQIGKAKDAERKSDLKKISTALEDYATDHGCYPLEADWEDSISPYLKPVPKDPQTNQSYTYTFPAGEVCEENGTTVGVKKFAIFTTLASETGTSYTEGNYVVTSPNYSLVELGTSLIGCYVCRTGTCTLVGNQSYCDDPTTCVGYPKYTNRNCSGNECCFSMCGPPERDCPF